MYLKPLITEKSLSQIENVNEYMFEVGKFITKPQAKKLIEDMFKVKVLSIRTKPHRGKFKKAGKRGGKIKQSDKKFLLVRLNKKDKISLFEIKENK